MKCLLLFFATVLGIYANAQNKSLSQSDSLRIVRGIQETIHAALNQGNSKRLDETGASVALKKLDKYYVESQASQLSSGMQESLKGQIQILNVLLLSNIQNQSAFLALQDSIRNRAKALIATTIRHDLQQAQMYDWIALAYGDMPQNAEDVIYNSGNAASLYHKIHNVEGEYKALFQMANAQLEIGNLEAAEKSALACLNLHYKGNNPKLYEVYSMLSIINSHLGHFDKATKYGMEGLKNVDDNTDSSEGYGLLLTSVGITYNAQDQYDDALKYYLKALAVFEKIKSINNIYILVGDVSRLYVLNNPQKAIEFLDKYLSKYPYNNNQELAEGFVTLYTRYLNAYTKKQEFAAGKKYADSLLKLTSLFPPEAPIQTVIYSPVLEYFLSSHQYDRASDLIPHYLHVAERNRILPLIRDCYEMWSLTDSAKGNYKAAYQHFAIYKKLSDSLIGIQKNRDISRLRIAYETEKKDKNILLLNKETQVQKAALGKAQLLRNIILISIIALVIILLLIINQYRIKKKNNELISDQNKQLTQLNHKQEWLLKEVHHRVKNNLHTIVSLLETQSRNLKNEAYDVLQKSQNRVFAMSLIHQKLYKQTNVSAIEIDEYLIELIDYLNESYGIGNRIIFELDLEKLALDVSQSIPIGLIANEAITNALKYAFPPGHMHPEITIKMAQLESNLIAFTIADNGIGFTIDTTKFGMGLELIAGLSKDIDGSFDINSDNGVLITIVFKKHPTFVEEFV